MPRGRDQMLCMAQLIFSRLPAELIRADES